MMLREQLLIGPRKQVSVAPPQASNLQVPLLSRKRREYVPVNEEDNIAWCFNPKLGEREEVFRCPTDSNRWISREEKTSIVRLFDDTLVAFTSRKGNIPILSPKEGSEGWLRLPNEDHRKRHEFKGGRWRCCLRGHPHNVTAETELRHML